MRYGSSTIRMRPFAAGLLAVFAVLCIGCREDGTVRVRSLTFKGTRAVDDAPLRAAIATRVSSRLPWGREARFDRARFTADTQRIQAFYADRGFPDARVTSVDVRLNARQDAVDLTVSIDEGVPVTVTAVTFDGFDVLAPDRLAAVRAGMPLTVGEPRDRRDVIRAQEIALNELREHGYAYAKVATQEDDGPGGKTATIVFRADPGPLTRFGSIEIAGTRSVDARIIERQLTYRPGDLYRRSLVQTSQRRLYTMQLFQFVNIEMLNPERQEPQLRTRVTVAEGRHQRANFGVGYGTEEKARADGEYHHVNFFGGAREAGAHARWSSLDRGVRLDFTQPYFIDPGLALGGEAQQWWTYTPVYRSVVTGGKATLTRRLSTRMSWTLSLISERTSSTIDLDQLPDQTRRDELRDDLIALGLDPSTNRQEGTLNALAFDYQRTTADNLLDARTGYQLAFHVEEAGRLLPGTFNYYAVSTDGRHYQPMSTRLVWANRLQLGGMWPIANRPGNVPFNKKYFLGGASSIRGWGRFEVGPLSEGFPVGGNALVAFTSEVRATLSNRLGGVLFLDGGHVWPDTHGIRLGDLRYASGAGLRYQTPVGPLRFDLGYQLNRLPGLRVEGQPEGRRWRMHFSIGQAF